jgi:hypothetical protein
MPLTGWRLWRVDPNGTLRSLWKSSHTPWTAAPQRAGCTPGTRRSFTFGYSTGHRAPHAGCDCGYHVLLTPAQLDGLRAPCLVAAGTARVWGTVVPHALGYRAEWCQITALLDGPIPGSIHQRWASADQVRLAAAHYQLPVLPADLADEGRWDCEQGSTRT